MNKFFCISALVCLASMVVALPSGAWNTKSSSSSGWTAEGNGRSDGWVSSESVEDLRPQSIPISWQKVRKQNTDWVKSGGWDAKKSNNGWDKTALNPPSQEIAQALFVKHPLPNLRLSEWTKSVLPAAGWDKEPTAEDWKQASVINISAEKEAWEGKSASSGWEKNAASAKKSAADYAAANAAHAEYQKQAALSAWRKKHTSTAGWEEKSTANDWQRGNASEEAWQKSASPLAWKDVPAGWEKEASLPSGWDADSDFKAWQKETAANGWDMSTASKAWLKDALASGWEKEAAVGMWQKNADPNAWQKEAAASGWQNDDDSATSGWQSASDVYNTKKARGSAPSKWEN